MGHGHPVVEEGDEQTVGDGPLRLPPAPAAPSATGRDEPSPPARPQLGQQVVERNHRQAGKLTERGRFAAEAVVVHAAKYQPPALFRNESTTSKTTTESRCGGGTRTR